METISIGQLEYGSEQYQEAVVLRELVLRKPLGLKFEPVHLAGDPDEYHIAATDGSQIVGILLLRPISDKRIKMRQVAVHPDLQGKGIGQQMVQFSETFAFSLGFQIMELHARLVALNFYQNLSYQTEGEQFFEVGIPHFKMAKNLVEK